MTTRKIAAYCMLLLLTAIGCPDLFAAISQATKQTGYSQTTGGEVFLLSPPKGDGSTVVKAAFYLRDIVEINDESETFQFTGVLTLSWLDQRQAFDPVRQKTRLKTYQGDYQFNELSPGWYPQVVLENESGMFETHGILLRVQPDGTSTLVQTISAIAESDFTMQRYPFDSQRLAAVFELIGFDNIEVMFEAETGSADQSWQDVKVSEWEILGVRSTTGQQAAPYAGKPSVSSTFTLAIDVQRKPFFVVRLVIIPLVVIVVLSWAVFWMDRSSLGDRINVSFIGILTAVAYQNLVSDILPNISYFTLMNAFVNLSFLIMCATVAINLIVGSFDKHGKSHIGDLVDYRCRWIFPLAYIGLLFVIVTITFVFF